MKVRITTTDPLLGTASANPELYEEFIGGKCADKDRVKEEMESLGTEELVEKSMTVFHKDSEGRPILYDYQIRGFVKEMFGIFVEVDPMTIGGKKTVKKDRKGNPVLNKDGTEKTETKGGIRLSRNTFRRFVDNYVFVTPREIPIIVPDGTGITTCTRPLRGITLHGERIALAHSEEVAEKSVFEFDIQWTWPKLEELVRRALDHGIHKGIGQWRNRGKGRFNWEEI